MGVVQPAAQPPTLPFFPPFSTSVPLVFRFGAETMKSLSPLAIASKANAPPVYIRPPLFPHFSIRPFYFVSTAVHPKWYQRFFPPLRFRPFFAPLSPFLSLSLELFLRYLSPFHRFEFFFSKRFFDRALPNFIPSCINICARIDKQRRGGGRKGTNYFAGREPYYIENCSRGETNSSTLEEDVRTVVQKSIRRRISRGRCDREQGGRWEGNKVAVCRSKCQISVAVSPFRAS